MSSKPAAPALGRSSGSQSLVTWRARFRSTAEVATDLETTMGDGVFVPGLEALAARCFSS